MEHLVSHSTHALQSQTQSNADLGEGGREC